MATKAAASVQSVEASDEAQDGPLLDSMNTAVKKLVMKGKERGFITYDELNAALPSDDFSSEQIEDTMSMISDLGINVVENEEEESSGEEKTIHQAMCPKRILDVQMIPCGCTCVRWALSSCCRARGKLRLPSG